MLQLLAARVYLAVGRTVRLTVGGIDSLFQGLSRGLLSDGVIDRISQLSYGSGDAYVRDGWLDSGFQFWEQLVVDRYFQQGPILVAAAGGGREVIALVRAGFETDGFDCSTAMVEAGKRALAARGLRAGLEWAAPCQVHRFEPEYHGLIVGWNGYTYISPRHRRIAFLRELTGMAVPGAPVLISGAFAARKTLSAVWTPRIANFARRLTFRPQEFETGDFFPGRPRHEFSRSQIQREMSDAGLEFCEFFSWGVFFAVVCRIPLVPVRPEP